jgi:hypothetical protein
MIGVTAAFFAALVGLFSAFSLVSLSMEMVAGFVLEVASVCAANRCRCFSFPFCARGA